MKLTGEALMDSVGFDDGGEVVAAVDEPVFHFVDLLVVGFVDGPSLIFAFKCIFIGFIICISFCPCWRHHFIYFIPAGLIKLRKLLHLEEVAEEARDTVDGAGMAFGIRTHH